uniref:Uncharacterized protein n=1 Tax=Quercus lobata TaxID=97700 RepID=A0A7N2KKG4_QUELO
MEFIGLKHPIWTWFKIFEMQPVVYVMYLHQADNCYAIINSSCPCRELKVAANLVKSKAKHIKTKASDFSPSPLKPTTKVFLFLKQPGLSQRNWNRVSLAAPIKRDSWNRSLSTRFDIFDTSEKSELHKLQQLKDEQVMLSILILGCFDPFELGLNLAWCNVVRGIMLNGRTIRVCLSDIAAEGRRITKLDQILLNGNNIAILVPGDSPDLE